MKKILLLFITLMMLVGCTNSIQNNVNDNIHNLTYTENYEYLNNLINNLRMFPTKELEEEYIYYVLAIKSNVGSYDKQQINELLNIMDFNYKFGLNKLNYTAKDYEKDLNYLKEYYG